VDILGYDGDPTMEMTDPGNADPDPHREMGSQSCGMPSVPIPWSGSVCVNRNETAPLLI
jgi:hypothetical protein